MEPMGAEFNRGVIQPMECYRTAWALIKPRYGLMLGITLVGCLIAGFGPLGILMGAMMSGIFLCYLKLIRGEAVAFNDLFKGFDFFLQSWVVALIQMIPVMLIQIPYVAWIVYLSFSTGFEAAQRGAKADPMAIYTPAFFISIGLDVVVLSVVGGILQGLLIFGYGLVADRNMKGLDAVKLSARAAMANLGGILGIIVINIILGFAGLLACYVGAILILPLTVGVWVVAYRKVFPEPMASTPV